MDLSNSDQHNEQEVLDMFGGIKQFDNTYSTAEQTHQSTALINMMNSIDDTAEQSDRQEGRSNRLKFSYHEVKPLYSCLDQDDYSDEEETKESARKSCLLQFQKSNRLATVQHLDINWDDIEQFRDEEPVELEEIKMETIEQLFGKDYRKRAESMARHEANAQTSERQSKVLTEEEVEEVLYGMPFLDEEQSHQIKLYLQDIIATITSGDEVEDMQQIERYARMISEQQGSKIDDVRDHLKKLREDYYIQISKGQTREQALKNTAENVVLGASQLIKGGFLFERAGNAVAIMASGGAQAGVMVAGSTIIAPFAWTMAGVMYIAETGINYRQLKKGVIDKKEFKRRAAIGAVAKLGGLAGTSIGAMTGFIIGSAIMPGVGSIVGLLIGGLTGGLLAQYLTIKTIATVEAAIKKSKEREKNAQADTQLQKN